MAASKFMVFIALSALIAVATALECYVCNSHLNAGCDSSELSKLERMKVKCTDRSARSTSINHHELVKKDRNTTRSAHLYTYCRKTVTTIPAQANADSEVMGPDSRVERTCGYDGDEAVGCKWQTSFGGIQVYTCKCTTDACNSAGSAVLSLAALLIVGLVFIKQYVY